MKVNKTTEYLVYLRKTARSSICCFLHYMFKNTARLASKTMSAQARTAPYTRAVVAAMRRL